MSIPPIAERRMEGICGIVEFAVTSNDRMGEMWGWWAQLDRRAKAMFTALFKRFIEKGNLQSDTTLKHLNGPVWEFKRQSYRALCYRLGDRLILTNALKKSGRKSIDPDIEKAKRIGEKHLEWEASQRQKGLPI